MRTVEPMPLTGDAAGHAAEAARRAGVEIACLEDLEGIRAASSVFTEVWGTADGDQQLPPELLRALTHAGNYAAGAFAGDEVVAAIVGFLGRDDEGTYLHSHILGVLPRYRGRDVGFALKQHQRAWALGQGLRKITWTFDPLVRRNAYFNVQKLGARIAAYHESFYGRMRDAVNSGDETDRLLVVWDLDAEPTLRAATGRLEAPDEPDDGAAMALAERDGGGPRAERIRAETIFCATPEDVVTLRSSDASKARSWRTALRTTLGTALDDGYRVSGVTRAGFYVLKRDGTHR